MKVETKSWKWAEAVKRKSVYRDYEFIRSPSKEEALKAIEFFLIQDRGYDYTVTVEVNGEYLTYWMHNMPCMGGLCKYKDTHGDKYSMNPYFPRDIDLAFPEGNTTYIAFRRPKADKMLDDPYYAFLFSPESPWISAFNDVSSVIFKNNYLVFTDMNTDPTVLYHFWTNAGIRGKFFGLTNGTYKNPKAQLIQQFFGYADFRRLCGQNPLKQSGGTWAEGYGYTRPYNEGIFFTNMPCSLDKFKDFSSDSPTYAGPLNSTHNGNVLKDVFGCDVRLLGWKPDMENMLVQAWDYFKQHAGELA